MKIVDERFALLYVSRTQPASIIVIPPHALRAATDESDHAFARLEDCTSYPDVIGTLFVRVPAGARIGAVGMEGDVGIRRLGDDGEVNNANISVDGADSSQMYAVTSPVIPGEIYQIN